MMTKKDLQNDRKHMAAMKECVAYCMKQAKESGAQILDDTTGCGYDSIDYIATQYEMLSKLHNDLSNSLVEVDSILKAIDSVDTLVDDIMRTIMTHNERHN